LLDDLGIENKINCDSISVIFLVKN